MDENRTKKFDCCEPHVESPKEIRAENLASIAMRRRNNKKKTKRWRSTRAQAKKGGKNVEFIKQEQQWARNENFEAPNIFHIATIHSVERLGTVNVSLSVPQDININFHSSFFRPSISLSSNIASMKIDNIVLCNFNELFAIPIFRSIRRSLSRVEFHPQKLFPLLLNFYYSSSSLSFVFSQFDT